ncbi:uncharacterized protein EI97DRAFT_88374 [Westerdykella ornata]|uniref:BZIP domain-containing protein n=1 Tax=Westerdykella ornata TaxID=318751 RepID=A0A6A6JFC3_WESOR|nr:uncharacterized protein EI97DRAFT_88374 [Westerdykella ornata]KAF2275112.1 hypothetical protein EI97DRAFT_88374 [Westerdykella ornata]
MPDSAVTDMTAPVGKTEPSRDGSASSNPSSPDADREPDPEPVGTYPQENPQQQQQKRKGGRKPIYATSEERKQRNRQAQAAFRERRTEYIKQLESTIKHQEETLQNLQNSHRNAADECLMLRYKNSLLERILLEKGIDVQAELRAKTGSPTVGPTRGPVSANASPSLAPLQQRAILNRQQQRRSIGGLPRADGNGLPLIQPDGPIPNRSPLAQPTPGSHIPSPAQSSTRSPNFVGQGTSVSPNFGPIPPQQQQQQQQQQAQQQQPRLRPHPPRPSFASVIAPQRPSVITNNPPSNGSSNASPAITQSSTSGGPHSFYPSPFESHMNQLDQEYDEQADMIDQDDPPDQSPAAGPAPFPQNYPQSQSMQPPIAPAQNTHFASSTAVASNENSQTAAVFNPMNHLFDPYDPMLDADPFGLSASMHFPTMYDSR